MGAVALHLSGHQVSGNDAPRFPINRHHVHQLVTVVHGHFAFGDLTAQGTVGSEQQLLTRLAFGVKRAAHLNTAKRTVVQHATVIAGKRHALGHALVDDVGADLGKAVNVGLAAPVVSSFDRVVKQTVDRVSVILVVLGCIDAALCRDGVRASGAVLKTERFDVVAHLSQGSRC